MNIFRYLKVGYFYIIALIIILSSFFIVSCSQLEHNSNPVLNRLVLVKYKAEVTQSDIDEAKETFFNLKEKVPGMLKVVWARDIDFDREKQFTFAILLSFSSEEALKSYREHPDHRNLVNNGPAIETFFAMNYWTGADGNKEVTLN